jgi:hypothetical protein
VIPHPSPNANAKYIFEQGQGKIDSGSVIAATIVALRSRKPALDPQFCGRFRE